MVIVTYPIIFTQDDLFWTFERYYWIESTPKYQKIGSKPCHIQLLMNISSELDKFAKKEFGFLLRPFENWTQVSTICSRYSPDLVSTDFNLRSLEHFINDNVQKKSWKQSFKIFFYEVVEKKKVITFLLNLHLFYVLSGRT